MTIKTVAHPESGKMFKLGRNRPPVHHRRAVPLKHFLSLSTLPSAPAVAHYTTAAEKAISQIYLNDVRGCCVVAAMAHIEGIFAGNAGVSAPLLFTDGQIEQTYSDIGGFDRSKDAADGSNPTDNGCDMPTALDYWQRTGFHGHKIAGWVRVEADHAKTACWLLENLMAGVDLADAWIKSPPDKSGFVWDIEPGTPNPDNGHCIAGGEYNKNGIGMATWGLVGWMTDRAVEKYTAPANGGELYAAISQESLDRATKRAPSGFDWEQLVAHFNALGGNLMVSG